MVSPMTRRNARCSMPRSIVSRSERSRAGIGRRPTWRIWHWFPARMAFPYRRFETPLGSGYRCQDELVAGAVRAEWPRRIARDHVHADGGVIASALFPFDLADFKRLGATLRERGETQPARVRVWVIMNFWTHPAVVAIDPASRAEISRRSTFVMFTTQQPQLLE